MCRSAADTATRVCSLPPPAPLYPLSTRTCTTYSWLGSRLHLRGRPAAFSRAPSPRSPTPLSRVVYTPPPHTLRPPSRATIAATSPQVRVHINRHVHAAFWVKATCADLNDRFVDSSFIRIPGKELIPYDTFGDPDHITAGSGMSVSQTCLISIDQHEKYNLAEGFTFVNISYSLLGGGAAFCSDPQRATKVERWNAPLEAAMEYHKSNMAFDELLQGYLDNVSGGAGTPFLWRSVPRAPFSHEQAGTAHTQDLQRDSAVLPNTVTQRKQVTHAFAWFRVWHEQKPHAARPGARSFSAPSLSTARDRDTCTHGRARAAAVHIARRVPGPVRRGLRGGRGEYGRCRPRRRH